MENIVYFSLTVGQDRLEHNYVIFNIFSGT